jgi:chemosensory pili system protein ChpC
MSSVASIQDLSALLVPVAGQLLVVPSAVVAEIIKRRDLQRPPEAPEWFLGTLQWHGESLPVLSFEGLNGQPVPDPALGSRLVIVSALSEDVRWRNFAILAQGVPHLLLMTPADLQPMDDPALLPAELMKVRVHGQSAVIPNFDYVERQLAYLK